MTRPPSPHGQLSEPKLNRKSVLALLVGVVFIIVVTTLVDIAMHLADVYPPMGRPLNDALALLATSYRIVIGIAGAWLTARLRREVAGSRRAVL